jgi:glucan phosphorylase
MGHSVNQLNKSAVERVHEADSNEKHTSLKTQKNPHKVTVAAKSHSAYSTKKPIIKSQYDVAGFIRRESPGVILSHRASMPKQREE